MAGPPWTPVDFGEETPGHAGLSAMGTTTATAFQITRKISVFNTVAAGAISALPVSYAANTELRVLNRGTNTLSVWPGAANQIENYGTGVVLGVAPGGNANFTSFDPPAKNSPRTWWLT